MNISIDNESTMSLDNSDYNSDNNNKPKKAFFQ